jgi:superfamily II DNA or RNA helicase
MVLDIERYKQTGLIGNALKDLIQDEAIDCWLRPPFRGKGVITAFTGFGKTILALKTILRYRVKFLEDKITLIVSTFALKEDWIKHFESINLLHYEVIVINSYVLHGQVEVTNKCGLLIVDEVHNVLGQNAEYFNKTISKTEYKFFLGLTATLPDNNRIELEKLGLTVAFSITIQEGKALDIVPDYIICNLGLELTEQEKNQYTNARLIFENVFTLFTGLTTKNAFEAAMMVAQGKGAKYKQQSEAAKNKAEKTIAISCQGKEMVVTRDKLLNLLAAMYAVSVPMIENQSGIMLKAMQQMSKTLQESSAKMRVIDEIVRSTDRQTIIFVKSINVANDIHSRHKANMVIYHSKLKATSKANNLEAYKRGLIQKLVCIEALDEGQDTKDTSLLVNGDYTGKELAFIQRLGRGIRLVKDKPIPIMINLFHRPFTREDNGIEFTIVPSDYKKLQNIQSSFKNILNIRNVEQLTALY